MSVRVKGRHWLTPDSLLSLASSSGQVVKMMDGEFHATILKKYLKSVLKNRLITNFLSLDFCKISNKTPYFENIYG